ncbi:MAG TPA: hypothetical protein VKE24_12505 [Candidatus Acidoferrales bacterium]|nr:hypothetical protein [Candidatus Acidoferrales bacterium]
MAATDAQVRKLMEELSKHGKLGLAAARAGLDPKTAAKYREVGKFPSELKQPRSWRTLRLAFGSPAQSAEPLRTSRGIVGNASAS